MIDNTTMALTTAEWRALVGVSIQQLLTFVSGVEAPTEEQVKGMFQHVDRMKVQMRAWQASAPPAPAADASSTPKTNGAAPKQRGWPKGKKRTPRAEQPSVQ